MNQHDQILALLDSDLAFCHDPMGQEALNQLCAAIKQALAAEPAPLVRLTDEVLINIYLASKAEWKATNKRQRQRIAVVFGSAIMDAMERVNGRKV